MLALKGASDDLFALMTRLATEKTRSDGTLVAGTARTDLASAANFGNVESAQKLYAACRFSPLYDIGSETLTAARRPRKRRRRRRALV